MRIKVDYEATMQAAQGFESSNELIRDAKRHQSSATGHLGQWEGRAAVKGKETLDNVSKLLAQFDSGLLKVGQWYISAAERWTTDDDKAAADIKKKASWDGAFNTFTIGRTSPSSGKLRPAGAEGGLKPLPLADWKPKKVSAGAPKAGRIGHHQDVRGIKAQRVPVRSLLTLLGTTAAMTGSEVIGTGAAGATGSVVAAGLRAKAVTNAGAAIGRGVSGAMGAAQGAGLGAKAVQNAGDTVGTGISGASAVGMPTSLSAGGLETGASMHARGVTATAVRKGFNCAAGTLESLQGPQVNKSAAAGGGGSRKWQGLSQSAHALATAQQVSGWVAASAGGAGTAPGVSLGDAVQAGVGSLQALGWSHAATPSVPATPSNTTLAQSAAVALPLGSFATLGTTIVTHATPTLSAQLSCFANTTVGSFQEAVAAAANPSVSADSASGAFDAGTAIGAGLAAGVVSMTGVAVGLKDKSATFNVEVASKQ